MREILFRGKRLQGENWVEGYFYKSDINKRERESGKATLIFTPDCDTFMFIPEAHNSVMVIAETVGQYTGLTDKNGKRVFEADILSIKCADEKSRPYPVYFGTYNVDEFGNDFHIGFYTKHFGEDISLGFLADSNGSTDFEVIGNIFDNPELMGGEANG